MSTPTDDEIRDAIAEDLLTGDAEKQIGDRRIRKEDSAKRLESLRQLAADTAAANNGPFIKIGFRGRPF